MKTENALETSNKIKKLIIIIALTKIGNIRTVRSIAYQNVGELYFNKSSLYQLSFQLLLFNYLESKKLR